MRVLSKLSQGRRWVPCGNKLERVTTHVLPTWHAYVDASSEGGSDMPGGIGGVLFFFARLRASVIFSEQMELKQAMTLVREGARTQP